MWVLLFGIASDGASAQVAADLPGTARITGKLVGADGKTPTGGRVLAYHLTSRRVFSSEPAKPNGQYEIDGLPYGYLDLAVETGEGLWLADRVVNLAPAGKTKLTLAMGAGAAATGLPADRVWPASQAKLVGAFEVREAMRGREFWRSPKGIALVTGAIGVVLLAIASGGGSSGSTN